MTMTTYSRTLLYQNPCKKSTTNLDWSLYFPIISHLDARGLCLVARMRMPTA